jgi:hypothetical protein
MKRWVVAVVLGGCPAAVAPTGPSSPTSAPAEAAPAAAQASAPSSPEKAPEKYTTQLVGLPVADAKRRAVAAGFTGKIEVLGVTDDPACTIGTVCRVMPERWELNVERLMTLYVAKDLGIQMPPD